MSAAGSFREKGDDKDSTKYGQEPALTGQTQRGLASRHVQLMMIAGAIGIGLFVGVGTVLSKTGPLPLLLGYTIYGVGFIYPTSLNVAEMAAWLPIRGSIYELAARFVDPALGFAMGWTYFFAGTMMVCTEYSAVATVVQFWDTSINPAVWVALSMATCYFINLVAVKWYGETEFVMASTKILLLVGLVFATIITMAGGNPHNDAYGFRNWQNGDAARPYFAEGSTGIFLSICISVRYAVFTMNGPDTLALAAGEIRNPRKTIPSIAKMIAYRIVGVYVIGILAVGIICNGRNPRLMGAIDSGSAGAAASPWVLGLLNAGIEGALPSLINALILLSGWSCGNAYLYGSSRTLYSLAQDGQAPKILLRCTKAGSPYICVTVVTLISCLAFLVASNNTSEVFTWFLDLTTVSLIVNFTAMSWVFINWRRALKKQNIPLIGKNTLKGGGWMSRIFNGGKPTPAPEVNDGTIIFPFIAPGGSVTPWFNLVLGCVISIFIGFDVFSPFSYRGLITSYFGLVWFWVMFVFWKFYKRTKFVDPGTADIFADGKKLEIDDECRQWETEGYEERLREEMKEMNFFARCWRKMWGE